MRKRRTDDQVATVLREVDRDLVKGHPAGSLGERTVMAKPGIRSGRLLLRTEPEVGMLRRQSAYRAGGKAPAGATAGFIGTGEDWRLHGQAGPHERESLAAQDPAQNVRIHDARRRTEARGLRPASGRLQFRWLERTMNSRVEPESDRPEITRRDDPGAARKRLDLRRARRRGVPTPITALLLTADDGPSGVLVGRCRTTLWADMGHPDPRPYELELIAVNACLPGDVLIAAAGPSARSGDLGRAVVNRRAELRVRRHNRGERRRPRDVRQMRVMGFPIFARHTSPYDSKDRQHVIDFDVPVESAGSSSHPGTSSSPTMTAWS